MVKIYAALVRKGLRSIDDVPKVIRTEVAKLLEEK